MSLPCEKGCAEAESRPASRCGTAMPSKASSARAARITGTTSRPGAFIAPSVKVGAWTRVDDDIAFAPFLCPYQ